MKLKYYLRGMGIGVIITTLILMVAFHLHQNEPLSDAEICERAEQLGMVMADELPEHDKLSDNPSPEADSVDLDEPDADLDTDTDADDGEAGSEDDTPAAAEPDAEAKDEAKNKADAEPDKKPAKDVVEQAEISIVGGEYSGDVCKKLKKAGLIDDTEDFNRYLSDGGYDSLIQPGTYVIPIGSDYDAIIAMITEKDE